jgi:DNA-binding Lrp family transcriptional regulator
MDSLDHRILDQLRENARAGYGDIGSVVGLSASAVKRRVDRLVADGVIRGFTIKVDPAVEDTLLDSVPEVVDAGTVTGSADAVVHMRSKDLPALEEALDRVRLAPQVDHTRSAIVLSRLVSRESA